MSSDYLIVHKKILPEYLEKVIEARNLLERHEVSTITEATQKTGISRNTYYKYKDYVFAWSGGKDDRIAIVSLLLKDESGALSSVLSTLSTYSISVLTISQAMPVARRANVLLSLDISAFSGPVNRVIEALEELPGVLDAHLDGVE